MGMVRAYVCVSPSLATELALCAGLDPKQKADSVSADEYARLHVQWRRWLAVLMGEEGDDFRAGRLKVRAGWQGTAILWGVRILYNSDTSAYCWHLLVLHIICLYVYVCVCPCWVVELVGLAPQD